MSIDPAVSAVQASGAERVHAPRGTTRRVASEEGAATEPPAVAGQLTQTRNVVRTGVLVSMAAGGAGLMVTSAALRLFGVRSEALAVVLLIVGSFAVATAIGLAVGYVFGRRETTRSTVVE